MNRISLIVVTLVGILTTTSCTEAGHPEKSSGIRQLDDNGARLPFSTSFEHRWSSANDGTPYEPCNGISASQLSTLGIDRTSVRDAAGTDGQTARGCRWTSIHNSTEGHWLWNQTVSNSAGIQEEVRRRSGVDDVWLDKVTIGDRRVALHTYSSGEFCSAYVESRKAIVITAVSHNGATTASVPELCERAIAFTKATIGRMPE
ncbi:DUF3558 family protein [Gordonia spumicola]|uniref:DUF3558 family protein n=1 Tax=Gordonia spumicola TaxID=589161 RepID=UPI001379CDC3